MKVTDEKDTMDDQYVFPHQALIHLSDVWLKMIRITNEGDDHSKAIAAEAIADIEAIQRMTEKV